MEQAGDRVFGASEVRKHRMCFFTILVRIRRSNRVSDQDPGAGSFGARVFASWRSRLRGDPRPAFVDTPPMVRRQTCHRRLDSQATHQVEGGICPRARRSREFACCKAAALPCSLPMASDVITPGFKTTPYWWEEAAPRDLPERPLPPETDVAIVGSGYTGLSAALTLAREGREVLVLDAERAGFGASSRNAGFVGSQLWSKLTPLAERYGTTIALALAGEAVSAHRFLVELLQREQISCHFSYCGRYIGAHSPASFAALAREAELLQRHFGIDAGMVQRTGQRAEIGSDFFHGGMVLPLAGALHPGLYHAGLLDRVLAAGVAIHPLTPVTGVTRARSGFTLSGPKGSLRAGRVIVATNGYTGALLPWLQRRMLPIHAGLGVSEPLPADLIRDVLPNGRTFIDTRRNPISIRLLPGGDRLQFTAARGLMVADHAAKAAEVRAAVAQAVPALGQVRFSHYWTGQMGFTFDKLPHVGEHDGVLYAMGYCGVGMPMATWLGHKLALRILGHADAATAFDHRGFPTRPLYHGRPWFLPLVLRWYELRDRWETRADRRAAPASDGRHK